MNEPVSRNEYEAYRQYVSNHERQYEAQIEKLNSTTDRLVVSTTELLEKVRSLNIIVTNHECEINDVKDSIGKINIRIAVLAVVCYFGGAVSSQLVPGLIL